MKLTLLQVINYYMDHTDGFRISTIDDGIEAQQVASIAEKVFYDLNNDVFGNTQLQSLVQLEALADNTKPNYLKLPDDAADILHDAVMYNISKDITEIEMKEIKYLTPLEFIDFIGTRKVKTTNQVVTDFGGYKMTIDNNKAPQYFTSFDDSHLVFDSYNSAVDTTLQSSKSGIVTHLQRTFTPSDTYIIDFPEWFHQTYLNTVMSEASAALREEPLPSIARLSRLGIVRARKKQRIGQRITAKDYGRH
jgi:hypothetical protein